MCFDTNDSFTLAAHVRLCADEPGTDMTVLSLPGANGDLLTLRYAADASSWQLVTAGEDGPGDGATLEWWDGSPAWSDGARLAVTYNAADESVRLFVDGHLAGTAAADLGTATGGLQVGRSFTGGAWGRVPRRRRRRGPRLRRRAVRGPNRRPPRRRAQVVAVPGGEWFR